MGIANKYNVVKKFNFTIPKEFKFTNLKGLVEKDGIDTVHKVNAFVINKKSRFGEAPVAVTDKELVDLPTHLLDTVLAMMNDEEVLEAVNAGKLGFKIYGYENKNTGGRTFYSVHWVDL